MRHMLTGAGKASVMQKCRVLLVDDHVPIRITLRGMLTGYNDVHVVGEACNGKKAIELVPLYQPHVVLMDFYMPRMNGVEAARIMKEHWQEIAIIGLLCGTGYVNYRRIHEGRSVSSRIKRPSRSSLFYDSTSLSQ